MFSSSGSSRVFIFFMMFFCIVRKGDTFCPLCYLKLLLTWVKCKQGGLAGACGGVQQLGLFCTVPCEHLNVISLPMLLTVVL